jgi:arginyl-tRNA synthetase
MTTVPDLSQRDLSQRNLSQRDLLSQREPGAPVSRSATAAPTMRDRLAVAITESLAAIAGGDLPPIHLERPARPEHGDWSSNVALAAAKSLGMAPRELATALKERIEANPPAHLGAVEVAGPGFLNFRLTPSWLHEALAEVLTLGPDAWASPDLGHGERVQIEFVSANPTGPLHVGNGWLCSYGDALARMMARCGYQVSREYYVNDTGGQIRKLGASLLARRRGEEPPEGGYKGAYVAELAERYDAPDTETPDTETPDTDAPDTDAPETDAPDTDAPETDAPETDAPDTEAVLAAGTWAARHILDNIKASLEVLGITFDEWYSQASIETSGAVEQTVAILAERGAVYEAGGALWLASSNLGDSRDRVLRKSPEKGGDYTYLAGDLAYHRDKFLIRGFDRVIDVFGADHHGQVASLMAGVQALGVEPGRLEVRLGQMVSLVSGTMSKREGNYVTLDELVADIGPGATRILSLVSSIDQAVVLDLDLVRKESAENPVFYIQYAHARIASIGRVAAERGVQLSTPSEAHLELLTHERELVLMRTLTELPDILTTAVAERAPHRVTTWVRELAARFHGFYHDCWVMGEGISPELTQARLSLVEASRIGLIIALGLLGVDAPESM